MPREEKHVLSLKFGGISFLKFTHAEAKYYNIVHIRQKFPFYRYQIHSNLRNSYTELEKGKICVEFWLEKWLMPTKLERQKLETRLAPKQIFRYGCYIILTLFRKQLRRSGIICKDWSLWEIKISIKETDVANKHDSYEQK